MKKKANKFVVLGAGAAGWFTALYFRSFFPEAKVTVIQNKKIGIIGVGEATVPIIMTALNFLEISLADVIKNCNSTIKQAISFVNWNGDGKSYYHAFEAPYPDYKVDGIFDHDSIIYHYKRLVKENQPIKENTFSHLLCDENKVDIHNLNFALHLDTYLFSEYLESIGTLRNIEIINGDYKDCQLDENGNVEKIILADGNQIECDFVLDCSGFNGLILNKKLGIKKHSYSKFLPMDSAIPFWLDYTKNKVIQPYTTATALKYGWMWEIPLQHRIGCGYVFSSRYITPEEAQAEVEQHFDSKIEVRKHIRFDPFRLEKFWYRNSIAFGLAAGFLEPLESTSIWLTIHELEHLRFSLDDIHTLDDVSIEVFNDITRKSWDSIANFIYLHYMTKRNDSKFWQEFRNITEVPENFERILHLIKNNNLKFRDLNVTLGMTTFNLHSYYQVGYGLELNEKIHDLGRYNSVSPNIEDNKELIKQMCDKAIEHDLFIAMNK